MPFHLERHISGVRAWISTCLVPMDCKFSAVLTTSLCNAAVTGCRVQFCGLMVITKHKLKLVPFWCKGLFGVQGTRSLSSQWIYDTIDRAFVVPQAF